MRPALLACALSFAALQAWAATALPSADELAAVAAEVKASEIAFAQAMAERKLDKFAEFVAEDAVFNGRGPQVGRTAVVAAWKRFFEAPQAPFSWGPDAVAPAADGRHAVSTGLVRDPAGKVTGRFTSLWRKDTDGRWRVVADQGVAAGCDAAKTEK